MKKTILDPKLRHDSQRGWFGYELYQQMAKDENIWLIVGDLGYKIFDDHFRDFPKRTKNVGSSEQAMIGIGVGLALEGKIPFIYSITTFLLYRPFETIRNYLHNERVPVRLVGSGRDKDYSHDGFSHWAQEDRKVLKILHNIEGVWPQEKEGIPQIVNDMVKINKPWYLNLKR